MTILDADAAVIGAGSVGSMASWQLAERGLRVIGLDRFTIPGPFSAYAGESRVFRMVYAEGGHYTPLLQRARDLWCELEAASGTELLTITGVVTIMDHDHSDHAALLRAGRERGLSFEVVAASQARHGFKMASSLGAVAADLITEGTTATDVSFMNPARFLPEKDAIDVLPLDAATRPRDEHP